MSQLTKLIEVTHNIRVTVDASKFTPQFMAEFREQFYDFDTIDEHLEHLAQLYARGMIHSFSNFIEGYGKPAEMGIRFEEMAVDTYVVDGVSR